MHEFSRDLLLDFESDETYFPVLSMAARYRFASTCNATGFVTASPKNVAR